MSQQNDNKPGLNEFDNYFFQKGRENGNEFLRNNQQDAPLEEGQGMGGDVVDSVQYGLAQAAGGLAETAYQVTDAEIFADARDKAGSVADAQLEQMSPEGREAMQSQIFEESAPDENGETSLKLGDGATNWKTWALQLSSLAGQMVPQIALGGGFASLGAKVAGKVAFKTAAKKAATQGATREAAEEAGKLAAKGVYDAVRTKGGIVSYAAVGTALSGGMIGNEVRDEALQMTDAQLDESNEYRKLYWQIKDMQPELEVAELRDLTKRTMADRAATAVQKDPLLLTSNLLMEAVGGKFLDDIFRGIGSGSRTVNAGKQFAVQGATEAVQGGIEQYASNSAMIDEGVDPNRDQFHNVKAAAANEGVLGGGLGGALGFASKGNPESQNPQSENTSDPQDPQDPSNPEFTGPRDFVGPRNPEADLQESVDRVQRESERGKYQGIASDILIAEKQGFTEEATRLRAAQRNFIVAQELLNEGDVESSKRFRERGLKIYRDVMEPNAPAGPEHSNLFPAEYVATDPEYLPKENPVGPYVGKQGETIEGEVPNPNQLGQPQEQLGYDFARRGNDPDTIYAGRDTADIDAAKQKTNDSFTQQQGETPYQVEEEPEIPLLGYDGGSIPGNDPDTIYTSHDTTERDNARQKSEQALTGQQGETPYTKQQRQAKAKAEMQKIANGESDNYDISITGSGQYQQIKIKALNDKYQKLPGGDIDLTDKEVSAIQQNDAELKRGNIRLPENKQTKRKIIQAAYKRALADQDNAKEGRGDPQADKEKALNRLTQIIADIKGKDVQDVHIKGVRGRKGRVKIGDDYQPVTFKIVDLDKNRALQPTMKKDENQFRDRERSSSAAQIASIAGKLDFNELGESPRMSEGAPTLTKEGQIVGGNGRIAAIQRAYKNKTAVSYKAELKKRAKEFGINPGSINGMSSPVLVRQFDNSVNVAKAAIESNNNNTMEMSALEQAAIDNRLAPNIPELDMNESGGINWNSDRNRNALRAFISALPSETQNSLLKANGSISPAGIRRFENALMHKAYGGGQVLDNLVENAQEESSLNLKAALQKLAPKIAMVNQSIRNGDLHNINITDHVVEAVELVESLRANGNTVENFANQLDMVSVTDPVTIEIAKQLEQNLSSQKALREQIGAYYDAILNAGHPEQSDLFGGNDLSLNSLLGINNEQANQTTKGQNGPGTKRPSTPKEEQSSGDQGQPATEPTAETTTKSNEDDLLTSYSEEDLIKIEADKVKTAEEKAKDEKEAADKIKADGEVGDFTLTGSDNEADIRNANGQNSLFDDSPEDVDTDPEFDEGYMEDIDSELDDLDGLEDLMDDFDQLEDFDSGYSESSFDSETDLANEIDDAASEAATSPSNDTPEPTEAQQEAGNYKKGHATIQGLKISIENERGSERKGIDPDGKKWSVKMAHHYGYIKNTVGSDGDHIDVFIGKNPEGNKVFIVDQLAQDGSFDEHKVMIGFDNRAMAVAGYKSNYEKYWKVGKVTQMEMSDFKDWLEYGDTTKPANQYRAADSVPLIKTLSENAAPKNGTTGLAALDNPDYDVETAPKPTSKLDSAEAAIDAEIDALGQELADLFKAQATKFNSGVDPQILAVGAKLGALYVSKGVVKFARWSQAILDQLKALGADPEDVKPALKEMYGATQARVDDDVFDTMDSMRDVRKFDLNSLDGKKNLGDNEENATDKGPGNDDSSDSNGDSGNTDRPTKVPRNDGTGVPGGNTGTRKNGSGGKGGSSSGTKTRPNNGTKRGDKDGATEPRFKLDDVENIANGTEKQRVDTNLAVIRLVKELLADNRKATNAEKAVLAKYTGWGGLSTVFDPRTKKKFAKEALAELESLLTPSELNAIRSSIRNAFYTSKEVVKGMWAGVEAFGLGSRKMNVLEPTVGSGNFIGWQPEEMRDKSNWSASELDTITGNIAKLIYDDANVVVKGFEKAPFKEGVFSLAIGNPPFGAETIRDSKMPDISGLNIHNYIIAKSAKLMHDNGLLMMVVTKNFLDTKSANHSELHKHVDFVGAVRLPNTAFKSNASTEVTTDIVVFRKLPEGQKAKNTVWTDTDGNVNGVKINKYYEQHPQNILGRLADDGSMYAYGNKEGDRKELTVHPTDEHADLTSSISAALTNMAKNVDLSVTDEQADSLAGEVMLTESDLPIGGMMLSDDGKVMLRDDDSDSGDAVVIEVSPDTVWSDNGKLLERVNDSLGNPAAFNKIWDDELVSSKTKTFKTDLKSKGFIAIKNFKDKKAGIDSVRLDIKDSVDRARLGHKRYSMLKDILRMRNTALSLMRSERQDRDDMDALRKQLNDEYDAFTKAHTTKKVTASIDGNLGLLNGDLGIESGLDQISKSGVVTKHAMFNTRMQMPYKAPSSAGNIDDAVNYAIQERGRIDIEYIASLMGISKDDAQDKLTRGSRPYLLMDPDENKYVFIDDYLSGNVKRKYEAAVSEGLTTNVKLLKPILPKDKPASKIKPSIRANWMDGEIYERFLESLGYSTKVTPIRAIGAVSVSVSGKIGQPELAAQFENKHKDIPDLFKAAVAGKNLTIYKKVDKESFKDEEATKTVNILINKMRDAFKVWAESDTDIKQKIADNFNERVNTHVERSYNGRLYLKTVGNNPKISLRKTQLDGALRMIQSKNVLLDHTVGAGKTFTAITGIMERKRLGLSKKPMIAVPNHIIGAFKHDFAALYPGSNVLAVSEKSMLPKNRKQFFARIATGNYDAIIIGHSHLPRMENDIAIEEEITNEKIEELRTALEEAREAAKAGGERGSSVTQIQARITALEKQLADRKLKNKEKTDSLGFNFSELGVDYLVVDEAHEFKNLMYSTTADRVVGMNDPKGSNKAFDLLMKVRAIQRHAKNGGVAFMTGTPISNSLVEVYTMMYYLGDKDLKDNSMSHYDAFAGSFLNTENAMEYTPTGTVKERIVLKGLNSVKELSTKYRQFADVITHKDMVEIYKQDVIAQNEKNGEDNDTKFPVPKVEGGSRRMVVGKVSSRQKMYNDYLIARMEAIQAVKGREERKEYAKIDNPLWVMSDARKASLDIRLVDPTAKREKTGKVYMAAEQIKAIYDKTFTIDNLDRFGEPDGTTRQEPGAQLVFSDMGTPSKFAKANVKKDLIEFAKLVMPEGKAKAYVASRLGHYEGNSPHEKTLTDIKDKIEAALESGLVDSEVEDKAGVMAFDLESSAITADTGFSVYDDLKALLIEMGVKEDEIAFIHDANTTAQKDALFEKVNNAEVKVLIGSTPKMGAGTNVQKRLVALHHLDAPFRPSDMEQREGRIIRQGNLFYKANPDGFSVDIPAYTMQGSSDPVMWQILERKSGAIEQFRAGDLEEFVDDGDSDADSYASFKANSTGNPIYKLKLTSDNDLLEAETALTAAGASKASAERILKYFDGDKLAITNKIEVVDSFNDLSYDVDSLSKLQADESKRYLALNTKFEEEMEAFEKLTPEEIKSQKIKKPTKPKRTAFYDLDHDLAREIKNKMILPGNKAIADKVKSWSESIDLGGGYKQHIELHLSKAPLEAMEGLYDITVEYSHNGVNFSQANTSAKTVSGAGRITTALNVVNTKNIALSNREIFVKQLKVLEKQKADAVPAAKKDITKFRDDARDQQNRNEWLEIEVGIADIKEEIRRGKEPNAFIDRDTKRNVKRSQFDIKSLKRVNREYRGQSYTTLGPVIASQGIGYNHTEPALNDATGDYVHIVIDGYHSNQNDKDTPVRVIEVKTKPKDVPEPEYDFLLEEMAEVEKPLLRKTTPRGATKNTSRKETVQGWVSETEAAIGKKVNVVGTKNDLPKSVKDNLGNELFNSNFDGFYDNKTGESWLIADQIIDQEHAIKTALHEAVGHGGVIKFFVKQQKNGGKKVTDALDDIYRRAGRKLIDKEVGRYGFDYTKESDRHAAVLEYIAHLAETGKRPNWMHKVIAAIKEAMRSIFPGLAWTDLDTLVLIEKGRKQLKNKDSGGGFGGGSLMRLSDDRSEIQKQMMDKIGPPTISQSIAESLRQVMNGWRLKVRQGVMDRFAALLEMDKKLLNGDPTSEGNISSSSWVRARMSNAASGAISALMTAGRVYLDPEEGVIDVKEGSHGLVHSLNKLGGADEVNRFLAWIAANRSEKLNDEGREFLFSEDEIKEGMRLNQGQLHDGRSRRETYEEVFAEFQQHRDDVLAIAEKAGIITAENREQWSNEFYVPFYRLMEDDDSVQGAKTTGGISRQQAYKKLKGGTQNINNLLENTIMNFHHLVDASMKNLAAQQAMDNALQLDIATEVSEHTKGKQATFVLREGKKVWYDITDDMVFQSLTALNSTGMNGSAMKAMRWFKRTFTNFTTSTPQFLVANLLRDSLSSMAVADLKYNPVGNVAGGIKSFGVLDKTSFERARLLASGGAFSFGHVYGEDSDAILYQIDGEMRRANLVTNPSQLAKLGLKQVKSAWDKWQDVGNSLENANRMSVFKQAEAAGKGKLYAAHQARDMMDFSGIGAWPAVRFLTDVVPFMNARLQGLDKLYRAGIKPTTKVVLNALGVGNIEANVSEKKAAGRFMAVVGALSLATMALYVHNQDDEEYKKLEDWHKDSYWWFRVPGTKHAITIPKPFEVGAIATLTERLLEQALDDKATGKLFAQRLGHMLSSTFSFSMIPQAIQPAIDVYSNKDSFTGRQIETMGQQRLSPSNRVTDRTTALAEGAGKGIESLLGADSKYSLSPIQIDYLISGYFGQVGAWAVGLGDVAINTLSSNEKPARHWYEYQPIRRFYKNLGDPGYDKQQTLFYEALRNAGRINADINQLSIDKELGEVSDLKKDNKELLAIRKKLNRVSRRLTAINSRMKQVKANAALSSEEKRREIDLLRIRKNALIESTKRLTGLLPQ